MTSPTLVIADYPIGHTSGFGETLYNLFDGFPSDSLLTAHPRHVAPAVGKERGHSIVLPSPKRPAWLPQFAAHGYYPFLKGSQYLATKQAKQLLIGVVRKYAVKNLLVIPVSPWILSASLAVHRTCPELNLVVFVMDDWQGHHESHGLPFTRRRRRLLIEIIKRANRHFAVSQEMAAHYADAFGNKWQVVHNGVRIGKLPIDQVAESPRRVLLAGDVNWFRFDSVLAFAKALERYNQRKHATLELIVLGEVAQPFRTTLASLRAVRLMGRKSHSECLESFHQADLLYLPLAFNSRCSRISLYSLPTKLPEYLASGKTILFHAPRKSAVFQVAERYELFPRLATTDSESLDRFVEAWVGNEAGIKGNAVKARKALFQEFDLVALSRSFQAAFE
jgi:hypothetical protein